MRSGRLVGKLLTVATGVAVIVATAVQANAVPIGQGVGTRVRVPTPFGANAGGLSPTGRGAATQQSANDAMLRQFDTNGNGRIDTAERKAMQSAAAQLRAGGPDLSKAQLLQQFDANGNGRLDGNELKSAKSALSASSALGAGLPGGGGVQTGAQGGFAPQGIGQQGVGGAAGAAGAKAARPFGNASKQKILEEFDTNGDGTIDTKERLAMTRIKSERRREEAEQKKAEAKAGAKGPRVVPKADAKADAKVDVKAAAKP